jgi:hypothetical protein
MRPRGPTSARTMIDHTMTGARFKASRPLGPISSESKPDDGQDEQYSRQIEIDVEGHANRFLMLTHPINHMSPPEHEDSKSFPHSGPKSLLRFEIPHLGACTESFPDATMSMSWRPLGAS